ncbi:hypothetical protein OSH42_22085, partial [Mycobacterium ulcerans]
MVADLPLGKWSAWLVGAWWPAPPEASAAGVTYWHRAGAIKHSEARDLQNERSRLAVNQGRTADDPMDRYWRGEQRLTAIGDQCDIKSVQSGRVVDAVNNLRDRLRDIAHSGNDEIDRILSGKGPTEAKVAAVNAVIAERNSEAANAAATTMSNIIDATQRVLDATIGGNARTWLSQLGADIDGPPPTLPITQNDLDSPPHTPPESSTLGLALQDASAPNEIAPEPPPSSTVGGALASHGSSTSAVVAPTPSPGDTTFGGAIRGLPGAPASPTGFTPAPSPLQPGAPAV